MNESVAIPLPRYDRCFVCGHQNAAGLDVEFVYRDGMIVAEFVPEERHAGYRGVVHGGVLAALLDECMGWTAIVSRRVMCVAAELTVRYKRRARVGEALRAECELVNDRRRVVLARGRILNESGEELCAGEGKFVPLPEDEQRAVVEYAQWGEALERAHEAIRAARRGME